MTTIQIILKREMKSKYNAVLLSVISILIFLNAVYAQNSKDSLKKDTQKANTVQIDTNRIINQIDTATIKQNTTLINDDKEPRLTNTRLFVYILMTAAGLAIFYYVFVQILFKTFHRTRSTRQSLMLCWNIYTSVSLIWIFIVWGLVGGFWISGAFTTIIIFLFIISLIAGIISVKSK